MRRMVGNVCFCTQDLETGLLSFAERNGRIVDQCQLSLSLSLFTISPETSEMVSNYNMFFAQHAWKMMVSMSQQDGVGPDLGFHWPACENGTNIEARVRKKRSANSRFQDPST